MIKFLAGLHCEYEGVWSQLLFKSDLSTLVETYFYVAHTFLEQDKRSDSVTGASTERSTVVTQVGFGSSIRGRNSFGRGGR